MTPWASDTADGYIYAIRCTFTGRVKIGWTRFAGCTDRLKACQTGSPTRLELVGYRPGTLTDESRIHDRIADYRLHGEWFKAHDQVHAVAALIAGSRDLSMDRANDIALMLGWWKKSSRTHAVSGYGGDAV